MKQDHFILMMWTTQWQGSTGGCPREPWHDLHSKIDGPAAYDVLTNFEERWLRAAKPSGIKKLKSSFDDALLKLDRILDIIKVSDVPSVGDDNPEAWHVQVFSQLVPNRYLTFLLVIYFFHLHYWLCIPFNADISFNWFEFC